MESSYSSRRVREEDRFRLRHQLLRLHELYHMMLKDIDLPLQGTVESLFASVSCTYRHVERAGDHHPKNAPPLAQVKRVAAYVQTDGADIALLDIRLFGEGGENLGDLTFIVDNGMKTTMSFLPGHLAKNITFEEEAEDMAAKALV